MCYQLTYKIIIFKSINNNNNNNKNLKHNLIKKCEKSLQKNTT